MLGNFFSSVTRLETWAKRTVQEDRTKGTPLSALGFQRLPDYVEKERLSATTIIPCETLPYPDRRELAPFSAELLGTASLDIMAFGGLMYVIQEKASDETTIFYGLVNDIQIEKIGVGRFIQCYLFSFAFEGAERNPLSAMAEKLTQRFIQGTRQFNLEEVVAHEIIPIAKIIESQAQIASSMGTRPLFRDPTSLDEASE